MSELYRRAALVTELHSSDCQRASEIGRLSEWQWPWPDNSWNCGFSVTSSTTLVEVRRLRQQFEADANATKLAIGNIPSCYTPHSLASNSIGQRFRSLSKWVARQLSKASRSNAKLGEESITDFFILRLKSNPIRGMTIESFTRNEEAVSGADLEIWLTGRSKKWLGLRVQSKMLSIDSKRYEKLFM